MLKSKAPNPHKRMRYTTACPLSKVPNLVLCRILGHVPLQTRLSYRLVCTRWCQLIEEMCAPKRQLKLFANWRDYEQHHFVLAQNGLDKCDPLKSGDSLVILPRFFNDRTTSYLLKLLPSLSSLVLVPSSDTPMYHFIFVFLSPWRTSLTSLAIFKLTTSFFPIDSDLLVQVTRAVDSALPQLRRLHLLFPLVSFFVLGGRRQQINGLPHFKTMHRLECLSLMDFTGDAYGLKAKLAPDGILCMYNHVK